MVNPRTLSKCVLRWTLALSTLAGSACVAVDGGPEGEGWEDKSADDFEGVKNGEGLFVINLGEEGQREIESDGRAPVTVEGITYSIGSNGNLWQQAAGQAEAQDL